MAHTVELNPNGLKPIRTVDERLVSYNIEMTEVTGGTFWKAYTPGQIAGTEEFPPMFASGLKDITAMAELMEYYPPIHLDNQHLRNLAKALGPAWIRVSGSWATKTYYDFDSVTGGKPPEGYQSVLTREQWTGVLDFVRCCGRQAPHFGQQLRGRSPGRRPIGTGSNREDLCVQSCLRRGY